MYWKVASSDVEFGGKKRKENQPSDEDVKQSLFEGSTYQPISISGNNPRSRGWDRAQSWTLE